MVHIAQVKVRPTKLRRPSPCSAEFVAMLGCWAATGDVLAADPQKCRSLADALFHCMRTTPVYPKPQPLHSNLLYHASRLQICCPAVLRVPMSNSKVAIFWDYENCIPPSTGPGCDVVNNLARIARLFGTVTTFRAYLDISAQSPKSALLRSHLQSSGLSMIDCPHNGKKDVVDKMILVDMLAFVVDHPAPATIILVAGDRDYAYAVSILKLRNYRVILVVPSLHTSHSLESQASLVIDWTAAALRPRPDPTGSSRPIRLPCPDLDPDLVTKLLKELRDPPVDEHAYPTASQSTQSLRSTSTRDLLERSRYSRNTGISDPTHEFTHRPASSGNATGLPVPKTPPRSRPVSLSTGSTRARGATVRAESPLPLKVPSPSSAMRPAFFSSFGSLSHDSRPPSPTINSQSTDDMPPVGKAACVLSSHKLSVLASPFEMPARPIAKAASPIACPTLLDNEHQTPQTDQVDRVAGPCDEDNGTRLGSIPHRVLGEGARDSAYRTSYVAPHATHSPSSRNVGLHLPDISSDRHISPDYSPPGSSASTGLYDEDQTWTMFKPLLYLLFAARGRGIARPLRSAIALDLVQSDRQVYQRAGVSKFRDYTALAEQAGLIELGGRDGDAWIAVHPNWLGVDDSVATPLSTLCRVSSPDPPKVIQDPRMSPPEWAAIPSCSSESSGMLPTLPIDWRNTASIPAQFKPLIDILLRLRAGGSYQTLRSAVGQLLVPEVYARAGVSGFKEYILRASEAQLVQCGGSGGHAWISLHPE